MPTAIDPLLPWTEHYIRFGFAVVPGLVDREFCAAALARAVEIVGNGLPLNQWTSKNTPTLYRPYYEGGNETDPIFDRIFEQPRLAAAVAELFGGEEHWNKQKNYYLMVRPFDPDASSALSPTGHIDFPTQPVPVLYRGFVMQVALHDMEPGGGNFSVFPGTHTLVQKAMMDNPSLRLSSGMLEGFTHPPPFEFVGKTGDACFFHHLVLHSGNPSHAARRTPRVALMVEAFRDRWLASIDPSRPNLSPWERSLALNGPYQAPPDVEAVNMRKRRDYIEALAKQASKTTTAAN